ncbi:hypothetical protein PEX1_075710 [Penicillium expansum]|uniref:AB hydrolase-1 domain-containing protein n=1 Tax=Penicillium expansum TaxID=27334 RepID=A0A0A2JTT4_PENEN|nr:hypothetical protein PEX2_091790 [Penicillium expansum]KGO40402.1 hypothetical protein PEX1_075710 [Penicillium expansum]KGO41109.1 hypothetical protein PEXP_084720 [Penicillium expansum]KGO58824.1 hypothetical protein PEX2_091790 [Penicillium expansum]
MTNPTIVFSLGAWVIPAVFDATRSHLEALGFPSECPAHPSIGAEPPTKTLSDDAASLRGVLTKLADEGRDLVVVAHSYGGVVASSSLEGLGKTTRAAEGKTGGVVKVVYLAAFALDKGQSLLGMLGGNYLPWMKVEGDYVLADGAGDIGWQDISLDKQEKWNSLALHTSRAVFSGESTFEPWSEIPCAYIVCEQDRALPPPFQELFASKMGGPENTYRLPSSHSPFLSMPDRLAEVLQQIVKA